MIERFGYINGGRYCMADIKSIEWEVSQLVKARLFPDEQSVLRSAMRSLFEAKPELKRKMVVAAYSDGDISLGKAAQIMGVCQEEMKDIVRESGGKIHLGPRNEKELKQDVVNASTNI
jgi:predicted HTH domain antitoxin